MTQFPPGPQVHTDSTVAGMGRKQGPETGYPVQPTGPPISMKEKCLEEKKNE